MFLLENSIKEKENNKNSYYIPAKDNISENLNYDRMIKISNKKDKDKLSESEYYNDSTNKLDFLRNKYNSIPQVINQIQNRNQNQNQNPNQILNSNQNMNININKINRIKIESAKKKTKSKSKRKSKPISKPISK